MRVLPGDAFGLAFEIERPVLVEAAPAMVGACRQRRQQAGGGEGENVAAIHAKSFQARRAHL
jgi:hypothetical protein